jgi:hypothetical protein
MTSVEMTSVIHSARSEFWGGGKLAIQDFNLRQVANFADRFDQATLLASRQTTQIAILKVNHGFQALAGLEI